MGLVGANGNRNLNDVDVTAKSNLPPLTVNKNVVSHYYYKNIIILGKLTTRKNIQKIEVSPSGADAERSQVDYYFKANQNQDSSSTTLSRNNYSKLLYNLRHPSLKLQQPQTLQQLDKSENSHLHLGENLSFAKPLTLSDCDCNNNYYNNIKKAVSLRESTITCLPGGDDDSNGFTDFGHLLNRFVSKVAHVLSAKFTILAVADRNLNTEGGFDNNRDCINSAVSSLNSIKNIVIIDHHADEVKPVNNESDQLNLISDSDIDSDFVVGDIIENGSARDSLIPETLITSTEITIPDDLKMKEERAVEVFLKSLVSGGVAGMCAKTTVAPLDRIKILLQAHSKHYSHLGVFSGLKGIVEKERFIALYKGNGAQMVRIFPYAATQFTSFEMYKKLFGEKYHIARFAAGSAAGVTAVALTYPLDTIRARLAFQVSGEHVYNGIYQCASQMFNNEGGIRALYRGFMPTIFGMIPYAGLSFYCFESFKYLCMKYFPGLTCKSHSKNTGGLVLMIPFKLLCGGVAGAVAQTVSYPLDVTRRRMQLAMMDERTKKFGMGMTSTIKMIYKENGVSRGLYRGMSINYLRAIPMVAVSFSTYELVKQMLHLDTGLQIKTG